MSENEPTGRDELGGRLRGLRSTQVDLMAFDRRLREALPPMPRERATGADVFRRFLTPASAIAACVLVIVAIGMSVFLLSGEPAIASTQRMAEVYRNGGTEHGDAMPISTIAEARHALSKKWPGSPQLPDEHSGMTPMSCCVHEVGRRQLACVTFMIDGEKVMMALAPSRDVHSPKGTEMKFGNTTYLTGSADGINMVMNAEGDTWMCLMGKLPHERLASLAKTLRE